MAEFKVEDYFGSEGGAADDSTDCTDAFQAALDALHAAGKTGTIVFPSGICRMAGSVAKDLSFSSSPQGMVIIRGTGDSAIRFVSTGGQRIDIYTLMSIIVKDMVFLGDMSGGGTNAEATTHLHITGEFALVDNCQFYGLGVSGAGGAMVRMQGERMSIVRDCVFRGTNGGLSPNIYLGSADSVLVENTIFADYGSYQGTSYSKGGGGCTHWIETLYSVATPRYSKAIFRNLYMDEGAQTSQLKITGFEWADVEHVFANVSGAGKGLILDGVKSANVRQSNFGYTSIDDKVGISANDVDLLRLQDVRFLPGTGESGVKRLELTGTTRKAIVDNCRKGSTDARLPIDIINTAGAELVIDGITTRGGATDYR